MKRYSAFAVLVALVLSAGPAFAQGTVLGWGNKQTPPQSGTNPQGQLKVAIVGGVNTVDTSGVPFQMNSSGYLVTSEGSKDRTYSSLLTLLSAVGLNSGNAVSNSIDPPPTNVFSQGTLLVTWGQAAAADSDSVNIAIYVTQKSSPQSGIKYNQAITLGASGLDSSYVLALPNGKPIPTFYITRNTLVNLAVAGTGATSTIYRFPLSVYRLGASATGIAIPLADLGDSYVPGNYLEITVANLHPRKNLTDVQVDLWPRVW